MSTIFYTSDLHIGHALVARERFDRACIEQHLVFSAVHRTDEEWTALAVKWHDKTLAENWDKVVSPDDTVVVAGDISAGSGGACRRALEWVKARNGVKRLIAGNHDPVHGMHRDAHKHYAAFMEVFKSPETFARIRVEGKEVMVSHFPYNGDHSAEDRHTPYRLRDEGVPIIHGHTHSTEKFSVSNAGTPQIHIGVDAWDMTPVPVSDIAAMVVGR